jgi:hypothetical protein
MCGTLGSFSAVEETVIAQRSLGRASSLFALFGCC